MTVPEMLFRMLAAFGAGCLIGWERESHGRPAGLRTNILACVASAAAMLVSFMLSETAGPSQDPALRADITRIPMGVLAGIGFLGGGTILRHGDFVRGVTTAASLWFVTILGLAFGCGFFALGGLGLGLALVTLIVLPKLERFLDSHWYATLLVRLSREGPSEAELQARIEGHGARVLSMKLDNDVVTGQRALTYAVRCRRRQRFELPSRVVQALAQTPGVVFAAWE